MSVFDKFFKLNTNESINPMADIKQKNKAMNIIQTATHNKLSITEAERVYEAIATKAMTLPTDNAKIKEAMAILTEMKANWLTAEEKENFIAGVWLCECAKDSHSNSGITYINSEELQYTRKAILGTAFKEATRPGNAVETHVDWNL